MLVRNVDGAVGAPVSVSQPVPPSVLAEKALSGTADSVNPEEVARRVREEWAEREAQWVEPPFTLKEQVEMAKRAKRFAAAGSERAALAILVQIYPSWGPTCYDGADTEWVANQELSRLQDLLWNSSDDDRNAFSRYVHYCCRSGYRSGIEGH